MINQKTIPFVFLGEEPSPVVNVSVQAAAFGRDFFEAPLDEDTHLFFGRVKPLKAVYVELKSPVGYGSTSIDYWNGTDWASLQYVDETLGFRRSGFIQWDIPGDWAPKAVGQKTGYYIRFSGNALDSAPQIQGLNLVFSDDEDLRAVLPQVANYKEAGELSYILRHETARDDIVQWVRNSGQLKESKQLGAHAQIQAWDLLNIEEVRNWSKYLVLANIASGLQSEENGVWKQKMEEWRNRAEDSKAAFYLTLDKNDDGIEQPVEAAQDITIRTITRR